MLVFQIITICPLSLPSRSSRYPRLDPPTQSSIWRNIWMANYFIVVVCQLVTTFWGNWEIENQVFVSNDRILHVFYIFFIFMFDELYSGKMKGLGLWCNQNGNMCYSHHYIKRTVLLNDLVWNFSINLY